MRGGSDSTLVDSRENGGYLEGDGFELTDNSMNHSLVNERSWFLGMRTVLCMGQGFMCATIYLY